MRKTIVVLIITAIFLVLAGSAQAIRLNPTLEPASGNSGKPDASLIDQLVELKSKSEQLKKTISQIDVKLDKVDKQLKWIQKETTDTQLEIAQLDETLDSRVVAVYKEEKELGPVQILLNSESITDLINRMEVLEYILTSDASTLVKIKEKKLTLLDMKEAALVSRQKLVTLKDDKERSFYDYVRTKESLKKRWL